ncbi:anti-sigma factor domain-containing protein [Aerococcus sp. Group 1]|uniref:anti-sigma factor domain-containing protein n=1 Tax=Aerococcus urinae (strain CCUG 59500 / ACS-120-V-Col10a) TaxID=2976812 RepID=UPI0002F0595C|nr:anti-sigma factor domain-containing protein [Aerococcus sp. Group 1]
MYQEVVIIEVKEDYSLAMSRSGQVIRIKNKAGMHVGARIYVTEEDLFQSAATDKVVPMRSKRKGSAKPWWKALALAAMALLLIGTGTWASQWLQRENALAVGQNPSVQVTTNRDQQVTGVYDANAQPHSDSELKGKGLSEVLDDLLGSIKYPENENILVAMTKTDEVSMRKIEEAISKYFQDSGYSGDLIFLRGESSEFRAAKEAGRSYTSYLVDQYQLDIWNKDQNDDLSDQEKASRLSGHGSFRSINNQEQEDEKDKEKEDKEDDKKEEKTKVSSLPMTQKHKISKTTSKIKVRQPEINRKPHQKMLHLVKRQVALHPSQASLRQLSPLRSQVNPKAHRFIIQVVMTMIGMMTGTTMIGMMISL